MSDKFGLGDVQKRLKEGQRKLMVSLTNQAQNYFLDSFTKQGWDGKDWQEVQRRITDTKAYKYPKTKGLQRRTSPILVGAGYKIRGGTLRRAVSAMSRTAQINGLQSRMVIELPYAKFNNEGTDKLPQRKFVGQTSQLTEMQRNIIDKQIKEIWQA